MKRELQQLYGYNNNQEMHGFENINMVTVDDDIQRQHQQQQQQQTTGFDPIDNTDIWLNNGNEEQHHFNVNDTNYINFSTDFPPLPDFPCMSSSSSTSNSPPTDSSSSTQAEEDHFHKKIQFDNTVNGDQDCLNVIENLGYMDLIDGNHDFLDPMSSFFQSENPQKHNQNQQQQEGEVQFENEQLSIFQGDSELAVMFFEWLKQNKDYISAEDMRSIKLKRSTIESASKRLGSTKEGKKQLLRLILDWVEQHRLQKNQMSEAVANQENFQNSAPNSNFHYNTVGTDPNACFYPSPWMATPSYNVTNFPDSTPVMAGQIPGYIGDPYSNGSLFASHFNQTMSGSASSPASTEYQHMDFTQSWLPSQFAVAAASQYNQFPDNSDSANNVAVVDQPQSLLGTQYPYQLLDGNGERLARLGSKEARKNRMARQRRLPLHHYRHQTQNQRQCNDQSVIMCRENCAIDTGNSPGNWVYWPSASAAPVMMVPQADSPQSHSTKRPALRSQNHQKHSSADKRQACKTEKNLKFLLQKVLKQSDVGNLGRIVLPKREAETHLPQLESRDGISIAMEDIGTSCVWNMKYRFWPNNKSRMYLLENTGDFVRANGLQEGDFIVIYADIKCGKYLIRGIKVRQNGPKSEGKKPAKKNLRNLSSTAASISSPVAQAVR
ncbi:B3 domain-containing transcription factor ABI3 [Nicotiana tomentosiformis]|uniref:B3 domain-containing transcription factor ABI3 n=1 Tax=Nicotiana tomentosiformis TaxID=4098 RepID=UPI00051C8905|nr:B3 domain-containing transcription factor ABI3 [Nicotiana tomentosiformis]XP_009609745.1 B3 domain-containing transcription factor ABI3 [Nicotiana tomentosiformis]